MERLSRQTNGPRAGSSLVSRGAGRTGFIFPMLGFSPVLRRIVCEGCLHHGAAPAVKLSALHELVDALDRTTGKEAWRLCAEIRASGLIEDIAACVPDSDAYRPVLMLLCLLTSVDIDVNAEDTLAILRDTGCFVHVVPHLFCNETLTVALACGACQNACADMELLHALEEHGGIERLHELARSDEASIAHAAGACLHNIDATIALATRAFDAIVRLQRAGRRRISARGQARRATCCRQLDISLAARCLSGGVSSPREPPNLVWAS